jgi:hypothetical protein
MGSASQFTKRKKWLWIAIAAGFVLVLCYVGLLMLSPAVGRNHLRGPVILSGSGAGYELGDVVWLSSPRDQYDPQAAVLYDWQAYSQTHNQMGFGPEIAIAAFGTLDARQRKYIVAVVCFGLGHDPFRASHYRNLVY